MFHNSEGGKHQDKKDVVSYKFPKNATVQVGDVAIPLGDIQISSYGLSYDHDSLRHFSKVNTHVVPKDPKIINTGICIIDDEIDPSLNPFRFPTREDYEKHAKGIRPDATLLPAMQIFTGAEPINAFAQIFKDVNEKVAKEKREEYFSQIMEHVNKDDVFPKSLSLIYDDRKVRHTNHIVLTFADKNTCKVIFDCNISVIYSFGGAARSFVTQVKKAGFDPYNCREKIVPGKPYWWGIYNKQNNYLMSLIFAKKVEEMIFDGVYKHIWQNLKKLGLNISSCGINYTKYNEKGTDECVPIAIQNQLDFLNCAKSEYTPDDARELGIRLRAQQAILSYLFTGSTVIPKFSDEQLWELCATSYMASDKSFPMKQGMEAQFAKFKNEKYKEGTWYPQFETVCKTIDEKIKSLPFADLSKLYLTIGIAGVTSLAPHFRSVLNEALLEKVENECQYCKMSSVGIDPQVIASMEAFPIKVLHNPKTQEFFYLKSFEADFKECLTIEPCQIQ